VEDVQAEKRGENKKRSLSGTAFYHKNGIHRKQKAAPRTTLRK